MTKLFIELYLDEDVDEMLADLLRRLLVIVDALTADEVRNTVQYI